MSVSDHVSPLCWRYGSEEMRSIFSEENTLALILSVEATLAEAEAEYGIIPKEAAAEIRRKATIQYVTPEAVWKREQEIGHDVMAMVELLTAACEGDAGKYVHFGATSYDIEDNRRSLQIRDAMHLVVKGLEEFGNALRERAKQYRTLPAIGRTHGQWAEPITFGFKYAKYLADVLSDYIDSRNFLGCHLVGKPMTGAVGTSASYLDITGGDKEKARAIGEYVMKKLGLDPALITDQVISRKMYADLAYHLAQIASTGEKFCWEIWDLQRPEIGEVWIKDYSKGRTVGSSAMPHKRNPVDAESTISLARVVKNNVSLALQNIPLHHERDLTNSANERIWIPESFLLTDEILARCEKIAAGMVVREANVRRNLERAGRLIFTEPLMMEMVRRGVGRQEAHEMLRIYANKLYDENPDADPAETLLSIGNVPLTQEEINSALESSKAYTGLAEERVDEVIAESEKYF